MLDPQSYVIMYGLTGGQQDDESEGKLLSRSCSSVDHQPGFGSTLWFWDLIKLLKDIYYEINKNILFG